MTSPSKRKNNITILLDDEIYQKISVDAKDTNETKTEIVREIVLSHYNKKTSKFLSNEIVEKVKCQLLLKILDEVVESKQFLRSTYNNLKKSDNDSMVDTKDLVDSAQRRSDKIVNYFLEKMDVPEEYYQEIYTRIVD